MIINSSLIRLIIIFSFVLLFPLVQKQWLNLYLFNTNDFSFYSILYYFSGLICPIFIIFNSLNKFTYYKFNNNNLNKIKGRKLLFILLFILVPLSFFITNYFYINLNLVFDLFVKVSFFSEISLIQRGLFIFIIYVLLIFKKTRIFVKKLVLANFLFIALFIWYAGINKVLISHNLLINKYLNLNNVNFINIIFLLTIEIIFYLWSFVSYKNNLSDWIVPVPLKKDFLFIFKIVIFYLSAIVYYSLLE